MIIWFLDCGNSCVTKVNLSAEREQELDNYLNEEGGDMYDWLSLHEDEFGVNLNTSSWMIAESDKVFEVDF